MNCSVGSKNIDKEIAMNRMLSYRPPRIALAYFAVATALHYFSPAGTVLYLPYHLLGSAFGLAGFCIMMWAWALFKRKKTAICLTGRTSELITRGPYRLTRNPMYLGMVLMLCGAAFILGSVVAFLAPLAFYVTVNDIFISFEERKMSLDFGNEYRSYQGHVRRWI